jgi:hypothetical protein
MAAESSVFANGRGIGTIPGAGKVEITEKDYSAATSGTQQLQIKSKTGSDVNLAGSTWDVDGRVYVDGNAEFWSNSAGLSDSQATEVANRWVQIPPNNSLYATAAADLTIPSLISDMFSAKTFHKGHIVSVDGVRTISITYTNTGSDAGRATCDVALTGTHLPVAVSINGITFHLKSWATTKAVADPPGAVLLPSASSGGAATT